MRTNLRRLRAITTKELITLTSYRFAMVMRLFSIWYFAVSFYFIGQFLGTAEALDDLGVGYFEFVLVGSIVTSFAIVGLTSFSDQIGEEQDEGTLEAILATPTPMWPIVVASFAVPSIFVLVETVVLVTVGFGIFGTGMPIAGLARSIPLLVLTAGSFAPLGILSASIIVLTKRGDAFGGPARQLTLLLSGALYPISVLPGWLAVVSKLIPATYGIRGTRALVEQDASLADVVDEMAILLVFIAALLPLSIAVFHRAVSAARRAGTLGTY